MSDNRYVHNQDAERGYLVGIAVQQERALFSVEDSLRELALLASTAGLDVVGQTYQRVRKINAKTLIGSGKLQEIVDDVINYDASVVIFDEELSPPSSARA